MVLKTGKTGLRQNSGLFFKFTKPLQMKKLEKYHQMKWSDKKSDPNIF